MNEFDKTIIDLSDKICLVTGANGGIGSVTADYFASAGATVLATDLQKDFSGKSLSHYRSFDLSLTDQLQECASWIKEIKPDILFNNAGIFDMGSVLDADLEQFDKLFNLNVRAMFFVLQAAAKSMVENNKAGSIINIASQAGHRGEALVAHYCASKAAVISYTQSAALALAKYKIRVNAISPGVIDTPMWDHVDSLFAKFESKQPGQKKIEVGQEVPLGRMGLPKDVARVAIFLASNQSEYVTAQTLSVDGGNVLR